MDSTKTKGSNGVVSNVVVRLFVVIYDNANCISVPMAWDDECAGAICAWAPGQKVATFASRADARKAIRVSTRWAQLQIERGEPANTDFTESRQCLQVVELCQPNTQDHARSKR